VGRASPRAASSDFQISNFKSEIPAPSPTPQECHICSNAPTIPSSPALPTQSEDHGARSARLLWGNHIVAGLGSHWAGERRRSLLNPATSTSPDPAEPHSPERGIHSASTRDLQYTHRADSCCLPRLRRSGIIEATRPKIILKLRRSAMFIVTKPTNLQAP